MIPISRNYGSGTRYTMQPLTVNIDGKTISFPNISDISESLDNEKNDWNCNNAMQDILWEYLQDITKGKKDDSSKSIECSKVPKEEDAQEYLYKFIEVFLLGPDDSPDTKFIKKKEIVKIKKKEIECEVIYIMSNSNGEKKKLENDSKKINKNTFDKTLRAICTKLKLEESNEDQN